MRGALRDLEDKLESVSTEEQREKAISLANAQEEWLYDDGWDEDMATYRKKRAELAEVFIHTSDILLIAMASWLHLCSPHASLSRSVYLAHTARQIGVSL